MIFHGRSRCSMCCNLENARCAASRTGALCRLVVFLSTTRKTRMGRMAVEE
jgi:hypothetical protein